MECLAGELVAGKYRVLRLLGQGSLGSVYLCREASTDRLVALRLPHSWLMASEQFRSQFWLELVAAGRIDSPNVVPVVDFGEDLELGSYYIATPYVAYPDLGTVLRENGALPDARSAAIVVPLLEALAGAHAAGVAHLNLKPSNVFVQIESAATTRVLVSDFGCARLARWAGTIVSLEYGSPEQAHGLDLDSRSDIYAVGVMLYEMLAGRRPFEAASAIDLARLHCGAPPPPPSGFRRVHPVLESVCLKALSKTPGARYQSADEMLQALEVVGKRVTPSKRASPVLEVKQDSLAPLEHPIPVIRDTIPKRHAGRTLVAAAGFAFAAWAGYELFPQQHGSAPRTLAASSTNVSEARSQLDLLVPAENGVTPVDHDTLGEGAPGGGALVEGALVEGALEGAPGEGAPGEGAPGEGALEAAPGAAALGEQIEPPQLVAIQSSDVPPPSATAQVVLGIVLPPGPVTEGLRRELDLPAITDCYRTSLNQPGAYQQPISSRLDLESINGRVSWAKLRARQVAPAARKCIERVARSARASDLLSAELEASVLLRFYPR